MNIYLCPLSLSPRVGGGGRDEPRPPPPIPRPELGPPPPARRISNDSRPIMPPAAPAPPNRGDRRIRVSL